MSNTKSSKRHLINFSDFFLTDFIIIRLSKLTASIHNANVEGHLRMSNDIQGQLKLDCCNRVFRLLYNLLDYSSTKALPCPTHKPLVYFTKVVRVPMLFIIEVLATYVCVYCTTQKFDSGK